jgi:hypothetical protein
MGNLRCFGLAALCAAAACGGDGSGSDGGGDGGGGDGRAADLAAPKSDLAGAGDLAQGGADLGAGATLASQHPCDKGIAGDPAVVWAEDFEEGSAGMVTARYDSANNPGGLALVADKPAKSCGQASARLTAGGAHSATDLYKKLPNHEELYVRWYAKYQANGPWHHTGVWFGGYNPPIPYPNPMAGLKPNGDDRFSIAIEPVYGTGMPNPRLDYYNYWMQMHSWQDMPMGTTAYYGNSMVHQNGFTADDDTWMCLEVHAKLNTDLASGTGAVLEVWKNDALVVRFDDQAPLGYWIKDKFCPMGADGSECTMYPPPQGTTMIPLDLQLRSTDSLQLNAFWPQNYITDVATADFGLDDMVVATQRVGCIQ